MDRLDGSAVGGQYLPNPGEQFVDEDWSGQFAGNVQEEAPKLSDQTIPTFPYYIVHVKNAKGSLTKTAKTPTARVIAFVNGGPDGTEGTVLFDDIYLKTSKTTMSDGVVVPKDPMDYKDDCDTLEAKLRKIARVGGFAKALPTDFPGDPQRKAELYAAQFAGAGEKGFDLIVEVRETSKTYQGVTKIVNQIVWESARALNDPAVGKKAKPGTSALDEAKEKIADRNKLAAAASGKDGRTAGSVSRKPGSLS